MSEIKEKLKPTSSINDYAISPTLPQAGYMFVDHARTVRSGHLGHALVEYESGKILAFVRLG